MHLSKHVLPSVERIVARNFGIYQPLTLTLWTPAQLTTALWLDAADTSTITLNGSTVSQWSDKSGNGRNAVQATASNQPTYTSNGLNGKPVLTFDGVNDFLVSPTNINRSVAPAFSAFFVFAETTNGGNTALFGQDDGNWDRFLLLSFSSSPSIQWGVTSDSTTFPLNESRTPDTYNHILSLQLNNQVENGSYVCLDGTARKVFTENGLDGTTSLAIGALATDGLYSINGYIAECVLTVNLTDLVTQQKMEGYLAWKWGLQANLPIDHPYYSAPPLV